MQNDTFKKRLKKTAYGKTNTSMIYLDGMRIPQYANQFWTSKQRAANRIHEIPYRACFKPDLPRFFIDHLTEPGDRVLDPFMGRGTTVIQAALMRRVAYGSDINPVCKMIVKPRLMPPTQMDVVEWFDRTKNYKAPKRFRADPDLMAFFHRDTLKELDRLRQYFTFKRDLTPTDRWVRMVILTRLHGHSSGFLSVRTMPPNQAITAEAQRRLNEKHHLTPPPRNVKAIVVRKTRQLLSNLNPNGRLNMALGNEMFRTMVGPAHDVDLQSGIVNLIVTSPPFLDVVDYDQDHWIRRWFANTPPIESEAICADENDWLDYMVQCFAEMKRVLHKSGWIAFDVGVVRGGKVDLVTSSIRAGVRAGLHPVCVIENHHDFTKTSHTWGVTNNMKGTNANRVVILRRE